MQFQSLGKWSVLAVLIGHGVDGELTALLCTLFGPSLVDLARCLVIDDDALGSVAINAVEDADDPYVSFIEYKAALHVGGNALFFDSMSVEVLQRLQSLLEPKLFVLEIGRASCRERV